MEDFRSELNDSKQPTRLRGTHLVNAIVDRLVTNHVDLAEVSLWDMKRLISDAVQIRSDRTCSQQSAS